MSINIIDTNSCELTYKDIKNKITYINIIDIDKKILNLYKYYVELIDFLDQRIKLNKEHVNNEIIIGKYKITILLNGINIYYENLYTCTNEYFIYGDKLFSNLNNYFKIHLKDNYISIGNNTKSAKI